MNEVDGLNLDPGPPLKELAFTNLSLRSDCCWLGSDPGHWTGHWLLVISNYFTSEHFGIPDWNTISSISSVLSTSQDPKGTVLKPKNLIIGQMFVHCELTLFWHHLNVSLVILSSKSDQCNVMGPTFGNIWLTAIYGVRILPSHLCRPGPRCRWSRVSLPQY